VREWHKKRSKWGMRGAERGMIIPKSEFQRGFTLIEIIVVIVILSIVSTITVKFVIDSLRIYTMTVNQKTLFDEGKLALERMCRDIRDAQIISVPNTGSSGTSITFIRTNATVYDVGLPGNPTGETITFQRNVGTNTLQKVKTLPLPPPPPSPMAENVTAFTVTRGAPATNNLDEITLVLTLSRGTGENVTLQSKVYPKNLNIDVTNTYKNFFRNWMEELSS